MLAKPTTRIAVIVELVMRGYIGPQSLFRNWPMNHVRSLRFFRVTSVLCVIGCADAATTPPLRPASTTRTDVASSAALVACAFAVKGSVETLLNDCTTDATILVPNGMTLDGNGHSITGVDPSGGHFLGAVVANGGTVAHVQNLVVTVSGLADVCDPSTPTDTRLRGILFKGASGSITGNSVHDLTQVGSGCQEGNSIEVRNAPFDGTHPNTMTVDIGNNTVTSFMKTGILANGDVQVDIHNNTIGASANQAFLAANSIQLGFGAQGIVKSNSIAGNQWCTLPNDDGTGVLLFESADFTTPISANVLVTQNVFTGNADIGIYMLGNGMTVNNNKVFDSSAIADCNLTGDDIGIDVDPSNIGSVLTNNKIGGFTTPISGSPLGSNKVNPNK